MSDSVQGHALLSRLVTPGLALLLAAIFAGRAVSPSYVPSRPMRTGGDQAVSSEGRLEALLTQDPLKVAQEAEAGRREREKAPRSWLDRLGLLRPSAHVAPAAGVRTCKQDGCGACLQDELGASPNVTILYELLRGGEGVEDRERRVRNRQATLYALLDARYRPVEHHALRYFFRGEQAVTFEWFKRQPNAGPDARVLLLWIDEGRDGGRPLEMLRTTLAAITTPGPDMPRIRVLGPTSTNEMLELLDDPTWDVSQGPWPKIPVLSPAATARSLFQPKLEERRNSDRHLDVRLFIGDDGRLAQLLVAELYERIPALMPERGTKDAHPWMVGWLPPGFGKRTCAGGVRVAILAEANTLYGDRWLRSLRNAGAALLKDRPYLKASAQTIVFEPFPFVSPIDGGEDSEPAAVGTLDPDYPLGAKQIDYLRRLGDQLSLSNRTSDRAYDAIGIFATDVYDTLLILQALRPRFPHTLFFTTDLDARFVHEDHLPYTRNLIVASHDGLSVEPDHPLESCVRLAPREFRDTYQTSLYLATREALAPGTPSPHAESLVRLHEIGSSRAVALNPPRLAPLDPSDAFRDERALFVRVANRVAALLPFMRPVNAADKGGEGASSIPFANHPVAVPLAIVAVVAIVLLFGLLGWGPRSHTKGLSWRLIGSVFVLWVVSCLGLLDRASRVEEFAQEPLVFDQGVSLWPSIIIRLALLAYCLVAIFHVRGLLVAAGESLRLSHRLFQSDDTLRWGQACRWLMGMGKPARLPLEHVWKKVERFVAAPVLLLRLPVYALAIYFLGGPFYVLAPAPVVPLRGEFAHAIERWTLVASLFAFFMVFAYVLETTFLSVRLIGRITDRERTVLPALLMRWHRAPGIADSSLDHPARFRDTLDRKLRLDLVRDVTRKVENLVYFPMVAMCLIVLARASVLDAWSWPKILVNTLLIFFASLLVCLVVLRRVVRREQGRTLRHLEVQRLIQVNNEPERKRLDLLRTQIQELSGGAFSPLLENPLIRSALLLATTVVALEKDLVPRLLSWL